MARVAISFGPRKLLQIDEIDPAMKLITQLLIFLHHNFLFFQNIFWKFLWFFFNKLIECPE